MTNARAARHAILTLLLATGARAQTSPANHLDVAQRMKQNAETLKHYTYKRRTEIILKGQPRGARVDLVRYVNGSKETIPLETPERSEQSRGGRGLRGKLVKRKIQGKKEEMERLKEAMNSYLSPDSDKMGAILRNLRVSETSSGPDADLKLSASGVKNSADSFTMIWSKAKGQPLSVDIRAEADGKPVQITTEYSTLPDGTFYPAQTVISAPKKNLRLTITNYDYVPSTEAEGSRARTSGEGQVSPSQASH